MTTLATLAQSTGKGLGWLLEVSLDSFATVAYRWSTVECAISGSQYQKRILTLGNIKRGFGLDHLPAAQTFTVELNNTDFGADWLVDRATVATSLFKARFRLSCALFEVNPSTGSVAVYTQQVGLFVCLEYPVRTDGSIQLSLADDSLGQLSDCLVPPTFRDWFTDAGTTTTNAPFNASTTDGDLDMMLDAGAPLPMQFGRWPYIGFGACAFNTARTPADFDVNMAVAPPIGEGSLNPGDPGYYQAAAHPDGFVPGHRETIYPILVLATRSSAALSANDVVALKGVFKKDIIHDFKGLAGAEIDIPQTMMTPGGGSMIWKPYKTQTITKDGYDWKLLWIAFDMARYFSWLSGSDPMGLQKLLAGIPSFNSSVATEDFFNVPCAKEYPAANTLPYSVSNTQFVRGDWAAMFKAFDHFKIVGSPGSGVNDGASSSRPGNATKILQDFVEYYSVMGSGAVDTARFARALLAMGNLQVRGQIFPAAAGAGAGTQSLTAKTSLFGIGSLRQAIADLCASTDLDLFITSAGQVAVVAQHADFDSQTTDYPVIQESRIGNVKDKTPSLAERWSPYNRIFISVDGGNQLGPYDEPVAIAAWGRVISRTIGSKWWDAINNSPPPSTTTTAANPLVWGVRKLEAVVRPIITFTTDLSVLAFELGDYFVLAWTRGGQGSAYAASLWRLEGMVITPGGAVQVTAVWMEDLRTTQPYLLDDEAFVVRMSPSGGHTLTVTTGSTTASMSAGSFITGGVAAGDQLLIRDSSETLQGFTRNRALRVVSVTDATHLVVDASDFGSAGAHVIATTDWVINRSAVTYPDSVSDPTNYPSDGAMYGKISSGAGLFTNSAPANKLLDG